ncbi:MAG TPA: glycosyltransferase family 1 protein [Lamprocystis sp. (in: g-proteobacteria)]|nr:glycosyltransferase family 1 protein [Lamprocystis sp. (in: g-proteobacteria)]
MFLTSVPIVEFSEPWGESFAQRLTRLSEGTQHVAYFYPQPDTSTFRYRVLNMIEALATTSVSVGASWFSMADLAYIDEIVDRADIIVICRCKYSVGFALMVMRARAQGKRVLFDIDDLVVDDRYVHLILNTLDQPTRESDLDFWFSQLGRHGAMMRVCDRVIVTNAFLAERVTAFCGLPTAVVPNFMNRAQLDHSASILADKCASHFARDGRIHLGYFSGTATHRRDFAIIADAVSGLLEDDPRAVLRIVGYLEPDDLVRRFGDRIEVFPFQNVLNLQRLIGEVEINLVPLQDNLFTHCKSELKVFEAAAVGTISIASPGFTLHRAIGDGAMGFVSPAHRWRETLSLMMDRLKTYPDMAMRAAEAALQCYVPEAQGPAIIHALFGEDDACS